MNKVPTSFFILVIIYLICFVTVLYAQEVKTLPVYDEASNEYKYPWKPSGWMPDGQGISFQSNFNENCHSGKTCIKLGYRESENSWVGIYWLADGSWEGPGINVYKALNVQRGTPIVLTFWARGKLGGEKAQFKAGGVGKANDSIKFAKTTAWIVLEKSWKQYRMDLSDEDLSNVVGGFCWVTNRDKNPGEKEVWIFLDDISYESR
jgi:hypothetical protein